jgi:hypothetical protein
MDGAKSRLERLGYRVTACPDPAWAADLLRGRHHYRLAAVSSALDPSSQAEILRAVERSPRPPKLMLLMDALDSSSIHARRDGMLTHRLTPDIDAFVRALAAEVPVRPKP